MKQFYALCLAAMAFGAAAQSYAPAFDGLMKSAEKPATVDDVIWKPNLEFSTSYQYEAGSNGYTVVGPTEVKYNYTNGMRGEIIMNTRGDDVYIKNPIPRVQIGSYIEGLMVEDDETEEFGIQCQLPQWLNALNYEDKVTGVVLSLATRTVKENGDSWFIPIDDPEKNVITYAMDDDENFVLDLGDDLWLATFFLYGDEDLSRGVWSGAAVNYVKYTEVPGNRAPVAMPEGAEVEKWGMIYSNGDRSHILNGAIVDDKVYLAGAMKDFPNSCIVGTIDGNTVTFEANQYIGETTTTYEYLVFRDAKFISSSDRGEVYDFTGDLHPSLTATFDPESRTISCPMNVAMFCNAGTSELYYSAYYVGPMFLPDTAENPIPVDPEFVEVIDFMPAFGYGGFEAELPLIGTEGAVLNKSQYFYVVYFDDEPYTFDPDIYPGVPAPMTEIPYDFEDGDSEDFRVKGISHIVCWRTDGFTSVGIQAIYKGASETTKSNVVTYQLSGVESVQLVREESVEYYDLSGKRVLNPAKGFYVRRAVLEDGTISSCKILRK